eukprot:XP_020393831.1 uncharacterized protein LOC109939866 [Zea mays]
MRAYAPAFSFWRATLARADCCSSAHPISRILFLFQNLQAVLARSYFVTGNLTLRAYEEDCEFADPAGSLRGLRRFKRNCTNFGSLLEKSNMKLTKWEDLEDKSIGHWRPIMSGDWSLVEIWIQARTILKAPWARLTRYEQIGRISRAWLQ